MTNRNYPRFALMILIVTLSWTVSAAFGQNLTLHLTTTSSGAMGPGGGPRNTTSTQYFGSDAMKTVSSDGQDSIIRFDSGKIISIDNKQKTYTEVTVDQLNEMFTKKTAEAGPDQEKMAQMRKMMGQMGQQMTDSVTVTKVGPGETIAGYETEKYLVKGFMEMEISAAPSLKMPALYYDAMKMRALRNPMFDMSKLYDEMKKIQGMALKTVMTMKMMNMEIKTVTEVTSVEKGPVPASTFEVPAGYKAVPMKF